MRRACMGLTCKTTNNQEVKKRRLSFFGGDVSGTRERARGGVVPLRRYHVLVMRCDGVDVGR